MVTNNFYTQLLYHIKYLMVLDMRFNITNEIEKNKIQISKSFLLVTKNMFSRNQANSLKSLKLLVQLN